MLFSHSVVSDSLPPHGRQHARLPCPLLSPGVFSNSCYNNISLVVSSPLGEIACKLPMGAYLQLCLLPDMNGSWHQVAIVLELQPQSDIRDSKYQHNPPFIGESYGIQVINGILSKFTCWWVYWVCRPIYGYCPSSQGHHWDTYT